MSHRLARLALATTVCWLASSASTAQGAAAETTVEEDARPGPPSGSSAELRPGSSEPPQPRPPPRGKQKRRGSDEEEEEEGGWAPSVYLRLSSGYDDNASLSEFYRPGNKTGSAVTAARASVGAAWSRGGFKTELTYEFTQTLYWSLHGIDQQGHGARLGARWRSKNILVAASFTPEVLFLTAPFGVYSFDEVAKAQFEVRLGRRLWLMCHYWFTHWDVRDPNWSYLTGNQNLARIYAEHRFGEVGSLGIGYQLDVVNLGIDNTELRSQQVQLLYAVPLSYVGHSAFVQATYWPAETVQLTGKVVAGRRFYPDVQADVQRGMTHRTLPQPRRDTVVDLRVDAAWEIVSNLDFDLYVFYRISDSTFDGTKVTGSFTNFAIMAGLTYRI